MGSRSRVSAGTSLWWRLWRCCEALSSARSCVHAPDDAPLASMVFVFQQERKGGRMCSLGVKNSSLNLLVRLQRHLFPGENGTHKSFSPGFTEITCNNKHNVVKLSLLGNNRSWVVICSLGAEDVGNKSIQTSRRCFWEK